MKDKLSDISLKYSFLGAFTAAMLCYTLFLINGYGCADTTNEAPILYVGGLWAVRLGRFLLPIVNGLTGMVIIPILCLIINVCCQALVTVILDKMWSFNNKAFIFFTAFVLTSAPACVTQHLYIYMSIAYGLAGLSATLFAYFAFFKKGIINAIISVFFLCFTLGLYQAYLGFSTAVILLTILLNLISGKTKELVKPVFKTILSGGLGLLLYWVLMKISLLLSNTTVPEYSGADSIGIFNSITNLNKSVSTAYLDFYLYFTQNSVFTFMFLIFAILISIHFVKLLISKNILGAVLMAAAITLLPLIFNIICIIVPERRVNQLMGHHMQLILPFIFVLINRISRKTFTNAMTCVIFTIVSLNLTVNAYATYLSAELSYIYNDTIVSAALSRIYNTEGYKENMTIIPLGFPDETKTQENNPLQNRNYFAEFKSFVFWHNLPWMSTWSKYLYRYHGICTEYPEEEYATLANTEEAINMPCFPEKDSIRIIDDKIIVKFGEQRP